MLQSVLGSGQGEQSDYVDLELEVFHLQCSSCNMVDVVVLCQLFKYTGHTCENVASVSFGRPSSLVHCSSGTGSLYLELSSTDNVRSLVLTLILHWLFFDVSEATLRLNDDTFWLCHWLVIYQDDITVRS